MIKKVPHEVLKLIAYMAMIVQDFAFLLPVVTMSTKYGTISVPVYNLIGRIAFPIFGFLIGDGYRHTRNRYHYGLRLLVWAILSEVPFDFARWGMMIWNDLNPIFTLFLGYLAICALGKPWKTGWKVYTTVALLAIAQLTGSNYGIPGVLMVVLLWLSGHCRWKALLRLVAILIPCVFFKSGGIFIAGIWVRAQLFSLFALIPISLYSGKKLSNRSFLGRMSYLIFPAVQLISWGCKLFMR